jgi:hypothetical protein
LHHRHHQPLGQREVVTVLRMPITRKISKCAYSSIFGGGGGLGERLAVRS